MKSYLKTKDFSVSQEPFELLYDEALEMLVTNPKPKDLNPYYDSEVYISHTDAKVSLVDRLYQNVKQYSLKKKIQLIDNQDIKSKKLLDFGAGTGDFLAKANLRGFNGEGIEPNEKARANAAKKGIHLFQNIEALKEKSYDVITLWHVLEHLPDLDKQVEKIASLLDDKGIVVVAVPNYKSYDARYYGEHWAAYDVPRHLWHFSKTSISRLFERHAMEVVSIRPMLFDSFYVSLLSEKYKGNKLYLINAFFVGLWSNMKACFSKEYSSLIYVIKKKK
ncbi:class I SAM-dependent methyltransferase [Flagellimonas sp. CMM7]|uniref:class I SAM-dependent methyltransferase n=1 Tax=Flagellimonas sp. CMM7 TaxID=2654676 RepID=UPI0013D4E4D2|nr:class I SAM-dependent methyltransferase [Flagellimonas sp. CMM7]UII81585.1 class I SAM-dependent methyltransferase [Flagellimonas sp. CMM7]